LLLLVQFFDVLVGSHFLYKTKQNNNGLMMG
jgi:hypothetical protein